MPQNFEKILKSQGDSSEIRETGKPCSNGKVRRSEFPYTCITRNKRSVDFGTRGKEEPYALPSSKNEKNLKNFFDLLTRNKRSADDVEKKSADKMEERSYNPLMPYPDEYPEEYQTIQNGPALIITRTTYTSIPDVTYTTTTTTTLPTFRQLEKAEEGFYQTLFDDEQKKPPKKILGNKLKIEKRRNEGKRTTKAKTGTKRNDENKEKNRKERKDRGGRIRMRKNA